VGKVKNCLWCVLFSELLLVWVQCCAYGTGDIVEQTLQFGVGEGRISIDFYWETKHVSSVLGFRRILFLDKTSPVMENILSQATEDRGEHKNASASLYKYTDASVESRRGRISSFLLAPLPGKQAKQIQNKYYQTNPKQKVVQSRSKNPKQSK